MANEKMTDTGKKKPAQSKAKAKAQRDKHMPPDPEPTPELLPPIKGDMGKLTVPKPPRICIEVEVEFAPELIGALHEFKKRMIGIGYDNTQFLPGMEALGKVLKENAKGTQASIILAFPDTPEVMAELQNIKHENDRTIWLFGTVKELPTTFKSETESKQGDLPLGGEGEDIEEGEE